MTSESAPAAKQPSADVPDTTAPGGGSAPDNPAARAGAARKSPAAKPRAGVPVWRTGKPDAMLARAVDVAREAVATIAGQGEIGAHLGVRSEGERTVTHLFESRLSGYVGWQWFAVLTRNSRSKVVTVSELGLLPSEESILAPEWVPWAERVRPEDEAQDAPADEIQGTDPEAGQPEGAEAAAAGGEIADGAEATDSVETTDSGETTDAAETTDSVEAADAVEADAAGPPEGDQQDRP